MNLFLKSYSELKQKKQFICQVICINDLVQPPRICEKMKSLIITHIHSRSKKTLVMSFSMKFQAQLWEIFLNCLLSSLMSTHYPRWRYSTPNESSHLVAHVCDGTRVQEKFCILLAVMIEKGNL